MEPANEHTGTLNPELEEDKECNVITEPQVISVPKPTPSVTKGLVDYIDNDSESDENDLTTQVGGNSSCATTPTAFGTPPPAGSKLVRTPPANGMKLTKFCTGATIHTASAKPVLAKDKHVQKKGGRF